MEDSNRIMVEIPEYESRRELILKWFKVLFVCEMVRLVMPIIKFVPLPDSVVTLLARVVSIVVIVVMFKLAPMNDRYRKAAIFYCISVGGSVILSLLQMGILSIVFSVCTIIASYHELNAHSEFTAAKDEKLSNRWHTLFGLELAGGIIAAFLAVIPVTIAVLAEVDAETTRWIATSVGSIVSMVMEVLYLIYLKQTIALLKKE